jgi:hypothetical protein
MKIGQKFKGKSIRNLLTYVPENTEVEVMIVNDRGDFQITWDKRTEIFGYQFLNNIKLYE